ncbi:MAG: hypothetical protein A2284_06590 [Deltaproteobacteria bacterium RIFOXYA12_FULL_61_11]|nr:MAG: hypothetical protein A2284_06590 [Deltaproteobacteria bacterium RIFOXYA12_FULL_61_11]
MVANLDELPDPLWELYFQRYPVLRRATTKEFFIGRGCPYACTFCVNGTLRRLYGGGAVRLRSPARIVSELLRIKQSAGLAAVYFNDDTFTADRAWLQEFLGRYRLEVGLPFTCAGRASLLTGEVVEALARAGCRWVEMGVECGDERRRRELLGKDESDEALAAAARRIKAAGMFLKTSNMIGLPGETPADALTTLRFNQELGADAATCSLFQPFPGLPLTERALALGLYVPSPERPFGAFSFQTSLLELPEAQRFLNLRRLFSFGLGFPRLLPLLPLLLKLPVARFYEGVAILFFLWTYRRYHQADLALVLAKAWQARGLR